MYILYATDKEGHTQKIGRFEELEDIQIRVSMFAKDVLIEIEYEKEID